MTATALPLHPQADVEAYAHALRADGYAYFPAVLGADEVAAMRRAMDALTANPESYDQHTLPTEGTFLDKSINNAFNRDPLFAQYLDREGIIEVVESAHGADCHCIGMTAWITGPGRPDQGLHADWQPLTLPEDIMLDERVQLPIFISTLHFYLNDIYPQLGPTNFVPGSHRAGRPPRSGEASWRGVEEQSILCRAGDAVLFRSEVWHRGTANTSTETRYLLQVHYAQRMITQKFPPYLNRFQFDEGLLARATPRQRRLLGDHTRGSYD